MKKLQSFQKNSDNRNAFVKYWAEFVRTHSDEAWSSQQAILINSMLQSAKQTRAQEAYLKKIRAATKK